MTIKLNIAKNVGKLLEPGKGLYQRTVRSGAWVFAVSITGQGFAIIRLIILARILAPHDFGLMGIALLAMATLETFTATGFEAALIQKKGKAEDYLDATWTVSVLRGLVLFIILFFAAPYVAILFDAPVATRIIRVIGVSVLLQGFTNIGVVYFQKELEFGKQFFYQLSGTLVDFVVAVSAALILRSVWALVYGLLASAIVRLIVSYLIHPYRPRFSLDLAKAKELFAFGKWLLGSSMLYFLIWQGDDILVGKLLGVTLLGFYQMAYRISNTPLTEILGVIGPVIFPAYSKLQDNLPALRQAYLKVLQFTTFISIPLAGGVFVLAPEFTSIFLGEKWMPMVPAIQVLVLAGLIRSVGAPAMSVFRAVGKPQINTKWQLIQLLVLAASIYPLTIQWGIVGTSLAVLLCVLAITGGLIFRGIKIMQCGVKNFSELIALPLINATIMVLLVCGLKNTFGTIGIGQFILLVVAGIATYLGITYLQDRFFNYGMRSLIKESLVSLKRG